MKREKQKYKQKSNKKKKTPKRGKSGTDLLQIDGSKSERSEVMENKSDRYD